MQVVATAGHVDHGKSTLVRALTGIEPDRWAEERRRGMTIDLGFAWTTLPDGSALAFVDVPGHERFVPNMLAGLGPVPAVVFVVAADQGWQQQSAEHLAAVDALGIRHGLLVVTRSDLHDPDAATHDATRRMARTTLAGAESVAVSAVTGHGMDDLRAALTRLVGSLPAADDSARLRLWVDRAFTIRGAGTVVTGTLGGGRLAVGDALELAPSRLRVRVRGLQSRGAAVQEVTGVARVAVNVRGATHDQIRRGDALVRTGEWLTSHQADVRLVNATETGAGAHLSLHVGSAAAPARLRIFPAAPGDPHRSGRLQLADPLPLSIGDRGVLRDPSKHDLVIGIEVLDPQPPALRRRGAAAERGQLLGQGWTPAAADEVRRRGVVSGTMLRSLGIDATSIEPLTGDWYVDDALRDKLSRDISEYVEHHRLDHPLEGGVPLREVQAALDLPDPAVVRALVRPPRRVDAGRIAHTSAAPELPPHVAEAVKTVRRGLAEDPFGAPTADALRSLGLGPRELAAAERVGLLLRLDGGVVLLPEAADRAMEMLSSLAQPFAVTDARQALKTTRRVAVPLLELLDRSGRTRRLADGNRVLTAT